MNRYEVGVHSDSIASILTLLTQLASSVTNVNDFFVSRSVKRWSWLLEKKVIGPGFLSIRMNSPSRIYLFRRQRAIVIGLLGTVHLTSLPIVLVPRNADSSFHEPFQCPVSSASYSSQWFIFRNEYQHRMGDSHWSYKMHAIPQIMTGSNGINENGYS